MKNNTFVFWGIGIFLIWLLSGILMTTFWGTTGRGQAGDMFGAINSLFSGFAFAGIIFTITIQREELKLQRDELKLQREEVAKSTLELAGQKENMSLQRFETTFFNMITAHDNIVSSVHVDGQLLRGRALIDEYYIYIKYDIEERNHDVVDTVNTYVSGMKNLLLCYTNFIFILQYITDTTSINKEVKHKYVDIFLAQLSTGQIGMYFFYTKMRRLKENSKAHQELILINEYNIKKFLVE